MNIKQVLKLCIYLVFGYVKDSGWFFVVCEVLHLN